jgi:hypothetical protein
VTRAARSASSLRSEVIEWLCRSGYSLFVLLKICTTHGAGV